MRVSTFIKKKTFHCCLRRIRVLFKGKKKKCMGISSVYEWKIPELRPFEVARGGGSVHAHRVNTDFPREKEEKNHGRYW